MVLCDCFGVVWGRALMSSNAQPEWTSHSRSMPVVLLLMAGRGRKWAPNSHLRLFWLGRSVSLGQTTMALEKNNRMDRSPLVGMPQFVWLPTLVWIQLHSLALNTP